MIVTSHGLCWQVPAHPGTCPGQTWHAWVPSQAGLVNIWITGEPNSGNPKLLFGFKWQENHFVQSDFFMDKKVQLLIAQVNNKNSVLSDCSPDSLEQLYGYRIPILLEIRGRSCDLDDYG